MSKILSSGQAPASVKTDFFSSTTLTDTAKPPTNIFRQFLASNHGNVGMMFGIFAIPIISAIGMSIDYASAVSAKTKIQAAIDSAALAAGRTLQTTGSTSEAKSAAQEHFDATMDSAVSATISIDSINASTGQIDISGSANVPTAFMNLVGVSSIAVKTATQVELAMGGDGDKDVEVAMMLDITGSMQGSKLTDMQAAAKDLIQIVLQGNELTKLKARIALVPFSESVNVKSYINQVADNLPYYKKFTHKYGSKKTWKLTNRCVSERTGTHAFTDAAPTSGQRVGRMYTSNASCRPAAAVVPLTDDQDLLESRINSFIASGYTGGHLGTAWAWYMLSPNWKSVWPTKSEPAPYDPESTTKVAILMTDGEYNTEYKDHIMTRWLKYNTPLNGSSDTQADILCTKMKEAGIIVYTVGFELNSNKAKSTMQNCATSDDHYFLAHDGEKLKEAFREIAFRIAQLRISK